jgi:hypothetical protein
MKIKPTKYYIQIIDQIEKVRTKNNVNWMDVLRIAFKNDPEAAKKCLRKINLQDQQISRLASKLCL